MSKTKYIRFRVSVELYNQLWIEAKSRGFVNVANYMRSLLLNRHIESRLCKINKNVNEILSVLK